MIAEFRGAYSWASNFYWAPFYVQGSQFNTNEHFFAACKTSDPNWCNRIAAAETAAAAKKLGQQAPLRPNWLQVRIGVMANGLWYKFFQHPDLQAKLIETHPQPLVEGNWWHDNFWGNCMCGNKSGNHPQCLEEGKNVLGQLLMAHRNTFYLMRNLNG